MLQLSTELKKIKLALSANSLKESYQTTYVIFTLSALGTKSYMPSDQRKGQAQSKCNEYAMAKTAQEITQ